MKKQGSLSQWLNQKCEGENLSLRQVAEKTGLSHTTIAEIKGGVKVSADTVRKLAEGFGGSGYQGRALVDELLALAGYRSEQPEGELSESMAEVIDKMSKFSEPQVKMMVSFADFLVEIGEPEIGRQQ